MSISLGICPPTYCPFCYLSTIYKSIDLSIHLSDYTNIQNIPLNYWAQIFLYLYTGRSPAKQAGNTSNQQSLQPLTAAVIREHTLIAETLAVLLGAQFNNEVSFKTYQVSNLKHSI